MSESVSERECIMNKIRSVLFVCHGNICRSVMAEYIMKKLVQDDPVLEKQNIRVSSAATSREETGNDIYPYAKQKLLEKNIPFAKHKARTLTRSDYEENDLLIGMDEENMHNLCRLYPEQRQKGGVRKRILEGRKLFCLPEFYGSERSVADPWYTGDFETAYVQIERGCRALCDLLKQL